MSLRVYPIVVRELDKGKAFLAHCNGRETKAANPCQAAIDVAAAAYPSTPHKVRRVTPLVFSLEVDVPEQPAPEVPKA